MLFNISSYITVPIMFAKLILIVTLTGFLAACGASDNTESGSSSSSQSNVAKATSSSATVSLPASSLAASSKRVSSSSRSSAPQQVTIQWNHPTERENESFFELDQIGGYEIRVRSSNSSSYSYYNISGNQTTSYVLNNYLNTMTIEIAVYDKQGLYSQFVTVSK
jgi:hypothetical protein